MDFETIYASVERACEGRRLEGHDKPLVVNLIISGEGGGAISGEGDSRGLRVSRGERRDAECTVSIAASDLEGLMTGKISPMAAFMGGKIKTSGNVMAIMNAAKDIR